MSRFKKVLHTKHLASGGLITNYYCTSQCAHCLYACSPRWEKRYIDAATTRRNLEKIKGLGCHAIHIGGGEPLLNPHGLKTVLEIARELQVRIDYVETNSSWFTDGDAAAALLQELKKVGLTTLLVSISPFHNEYIPFHKVKGVIAACGRTGITPFPWISAFYREIDSLDDRVPHRLTEYQERFGDDYLENIPARYWVHLGGRAVPTFQKVLAHQDYQTILAVNRRGCSELQDVSHFHLDLFGNYIPGLCSGLAVGRDDLGKPLDPDQYPILSILHASGINGLWELAMDRYAFQPSPTYLSKCHLCLDIRRHRVMAPGVASQELQPRAFYENL